MAAIIRNSVRSNLILNFIDSLTEDVGIPRNTLYMGIGRPQKWDITADSDDAIPTPYNNISSETEDWDDLMTLKRLTKSDVSVGIDVRRWVPNTEYDVYRHNWNGNIAGVDGSKPLDISESAYYVITANYDVYICISNNKDSSNDLVPPSTQSPSLGTALAAGATNFVNTASLFKTSDGYIWKKIAVTSAQDVVKFASSDFHPTKTLKTDPGISDYYQDQWVRQINSKMHAGGIYSIVLNSRGAGMSWTGEVHIQNAAAGTEALDGSGTSKVTIVGDGAGLQFIASFTNNTLQNIIITNPGAGYTFAKLTVVGASSQPLYDIIFTPLRGLGVDPVKDLSSHNLIVNTRMEYDGGTETGELFAKELTVTNEYRKVSLFYNPLNSGGASKATSTYMNNTYYMTVTSITNVEEDDIITVGGPGGVKGIVVDAGTAGVNNHIRVIKTSFEGSTSSSPSQDFTTTTFTTTSGGSGTITAIDFPELERGSGDVIYSDYRRPIARDLSQSEDIKIVIEF
jgi:hypothetical protein